MKASKPQPPVSRYLKAVYAEVPPRVEYRMTAFGEHFSTILDDIEKLQRRLEGQAGRQ